MKHTLTSLLCLVAVTGCQDGGAHYINPNDGSGITSLGRPDVQDFVLAADAMLESLYKSNAFAAQRAKDGGSPVLSIGRVTNDTKDNFNVSLLMQKMEISITNSGKARIATAAGFGGAPDQAAAEARRAAAFANGTTAAPLVPEFTIYGRILENRAQAGKVKQVTYTFQLSMTDVKSGLAVWQEEKAVTKQGSYNKVGF